MQTFSGTHTDAGQRLVSNGLIAIVLVTLAVTIAAALALLVSSDLLVAAADPIQVSPVRWIGRV